MEITAYHQHRWLLSEPPHLLLRKNIRIGLGRSQRRYEIKRGRANRRASESKDLLFARITLSLGVFALVRVLLRYPRHRAIMPDHFFFYGTLLPQHAPDHLREILAGFDFIGEGWLRGTLYDFGNYPGAVFDDYSHTRGFVRGRSATSEELLL